MSEKLDEVLIRNEFIRTWNNGKPYFEDREKFLRDLRNFCNTYRNHITVVVDMNERDKILTEELEEMAEMELTNTG
jgi:hypothetical protein